MRVYARESRLFGRLSRIPTERFGNTNFVQKTTNLVDLLARLVFFLYLCTRLECMKEKR